MSVSIDTVGAARRRVDARLKHTLATNQGGLPHYADTRTGQWVTTPDGDWTGGHFVGQLWLAASGDRRYVDAARDYLTRLDGRENSPTIFRGFLFHYGAALGGHLLDDDTGWASAVRGARALLNDFNPVTGVIPLGTAAEEAHSVGDAETSIDAVGAVSALLAAVADRTDDPSMRDAAISHARRHVEICVRADGSVCQSGTLDTATGDVVRHYSHKGYSASSTWARAQAWAMLAFSMSAHWLPENPEFLRAAVTVSDWWADHVPDDLVAFWDFDDPDVPRAPRDTAATAIAASALLKLARLVDEPDRYRILAERTVAALIDGYLRPVPGLPGDVGVLGSGCYNKLINLATDNELVWGDYYFAEALAVLDGMLDPLSV
jgi:unsaturated chondroitin disaccharide hydrolase